MGGGWVGRGVGLISGALSFLEEYADVCLALIGQAAHRPVAEDKEELGKSWTYVTCWIQYTAFRLPLCFASSSVARTPFEPSDSSCQWHGP